MYTYLRTQTVSLVWVRAADACFIDAADLFARRDQFHEAAKLYERVTDRPRKSSIRDSNDKEYLLRAGLCTLASEARNRASSLFLLCARTHFESDLQ